MHISTQSIDFTAPNEGALRTKTFRYILDSLVGPNKRVADLGAGPCVFAKIARDKGHQVTAVDGRDARVPEDLGSIQFVKADIRWFDISGYDVVLVLGLLYHLTLEDQISLLSRCRGQLVLDTQVHIRSLAVEDSSRERGMELDTLVAQDGYEGVLFPESDNNMASIGNSTSWWHTEPSMLRLLANCGFQSTVVVGAPYVSKYGARRWYVASR
jgi:hypothetical protein